MTNAVIQRNYNRILLYLLCRIVIAKIAFSKSLISATTPITLTATDDGTPPSGVDYTEYKVDSAAWQKYANPFTLNSLFNHRHGGEQPQVPRAVL